MWVLAPQKMYTYWLVCCNLCISCCLQASTAGLLLNGCQCNGIGCMIIVAVPPGSMYGGQDAWHDAEVLPYAIMNGALAISHGVFPHIEQDTARGVNVYCAVDNACVDNSSMLPASIAIVVMAPPSHICRKDDRHCRDAMHVGISAWMLLAGLSMCPRIHPLLQMCMPLPCCLPQSRTALPAAPCGCMYLSLYLYGYSLLA